MWRCACAMLSMSRGVPACWLMAAIWAGVMDFIISAAWAGRSQCRSRSTRKGITKQSERQNCHHFASSMTVEGRQEWQLAVVQVTELPHKQHLSTWDPPPAPVISSPGASSQDFASSSLLPVASAVAGCCQPMVRQLCWCSLKAPVAE